MYNYRVLNNLGGWLVFLAAFITYFLTMEPTSSFWDCGEFIAASYKLQVGHPPGAPLYLMIGRVFSFLAGGDPVKAAYWINMVSVVSSALTIAFLFWTITLIARKLIRHKSGQNNPQDYTPLQTWSIFAAALIGSLAYTWSDTFWFSAVEAEVYATSSLFTAVVFWAMLRWEAEADQPHADRWLILIAYLMGLSIGVHLLNLLTIPALAFIYYFRRYKSTTWGILATFIIGVFFLYFIQYGIIPGYVRASAVLESLFVNKLGLDVFTGLAFFTVYIFASLTIGLFYASKNNIPLAVYANLSFLSAFILTGKISLSLVAVALFIVIYFYFGKNSFKSFIYAATGIIPGYIIWKGLMADKSNDLFADKQNKYTTMHFVLMSTIVILLGFSSYSMIIIRSNANVPMDENNPADVYSLLSYLNREQYGSQPLFYGPYYNAQVDPKENYKDKGPVMALAYSIYDANGTRITYFSDNLEAQEFLNSDANKGYSLKVEYIEIDRKKEPNYVKNTTLFPRMWSGQDQRHVSGYKSWGNVKGNPDFIENITFFLRYHVNHMYIRYLYWNFVGRQSDEQNADGNNLNGNWQSGIGFIDGIFTGAKSTNLPEDMASNKGRNHYFFLPLLLGILGAVYHYRESKRSFLIVAMLFFLTGLAIVIYLNQVPYQPRERDYAYAGSFYAFAIWIGLGLMGLFNWLGAKTKKEGLPLLAGTTLVTALAVPVLLVSQNWDDHNRQNRYTAPDFAFNYLNSTDKDAILFTNGDNDTFPLWFLQEVEGVRTDVRVVNLSLLNTDWYIDQMKRAAYDGKSVEFDMRQDQYRAGSREQIIMDRENPNYYTLDQHFDWILKDDGSNQMNLGGGAKLYYLRSNKFIIPIDSAKVAANGSVPKGMEHRILKEIRFEIKRPYIMKSDLMILNLLKNFNWERPIYFAVTIGQDFMGLEEYFQLEGLAYRFVPYKADAQKPDIGEVNSDAMYTNLMTKFKWGNMEKDDVYLDETNRNMIYNMRNNFARLANQLIKENKKERAIEVLDYAAAIMPDHKIPFNEYNIYMVDAYFEAGAYEKGEAMLNRMKERVEQEIVYLNQFSGQRAKNLSYEKERAMGKQSVYGQLTQKLDYLKTLKNNPMQLEDAATPNP